jgi:cobalt-zinc-cadmium efflux system outer membrane protein
MRFIALALFVTTCWAQKTYTLQGTVQVVNTADKSLSVANDPIPGGMGAMTMTYSVDNGDVLPRLHPGDRITAQWHEGEMKLYAVSMVTPPMAEGMSLEQLEQIALSSNPTAAQADANTRVASALARQSGAYPNPTVGYYGDEIRGGSYSGGKQGGYFSQTIVTGGKLQAARKVAAVSAAESKTASEMQRQRIVNNVRMLFYQVLAAQRMVEVRDSLSKRADDAVQTGHQLSNIGQVDLPDVLQVEVEHEQANLHLRIAKQNLAAMWRTLAAVTGKPDLPLVHLAGDLDTIPALTYDQALATTLRESPEVKMAEQGVQKAEAVFAQAKKAPIPNLELSANLSQDNEPLDGPRKLVGLVGGVQLGVQLPLFNRNQGNIAAAKDEIEIARQELVRRKLEIARDLAARFRDYDAARSIAQQYKAELLPRAEQAYKLYIASYRNMAAAYPQALMSQRTLFQLEAEYVQALDAAWQASLSIRGFGLMDGLATPIR